MKKLALVLAVAAIAISGSAFAQDPNWRDNIGIYLDEAGTNNCTTSPAFVGIDAYLVLTKATAPDVAAWEIKLIPQNLQVVTMTFRGLAINGSGRENEYAIGLANPLPVVGGTCVLADFVFTLLPTQIGNPSYMFGEGVFFPSIDPSTTFGNKVPAYADSGNNIIELHQVNGTENDPIFSVNDVNCGAVSEEVGSWGSVKSLFR